MKKLFTLMALAMCVLQGYSADYRTFTKTEIFPTTKANVAHQINMGGVF